MTGVKRDKPRARRGHTTAAEVVATAAALVDREGVEALTIRRLAGECGVSPMAIYRHVRDKDELLDRVVDAVLGPGLDDIRLTGSWREQAVDLFRTMRRVLLDHPGIAQVCVLRATPVPNVARFFDLALAVMDEAGFGAADAVFAFDALLMFTFGSILWQIPRAETERQRLIRLAVLTGAETPALLAHATQLGQRNPDAHFAFGLDAILDGLEARLRAGGDGRRQ